MINKLETTKHIYTPLRHYHISNHTLGKGDSISVAYVLLYDTIQLSPAIKIVRKRVVQERTLLKIREINRLCREVKILSRTLAAADRPPWA